MGACLGRCFSKLSNTLSYRYHRHTSMPCQEEERVEIMDGEESDPVERSKTLLSFLSLKRFKRKPKIPVTLELSEKTGWSGKSSKYARLNCRNDASTSSGLDTSLQVLDARTLIKQQTCVSSTPGSSLDLEWEHEGMPLPIVNNNEDDLKPESVDVSPSESSRNSQPSSLTASPWSRVSTPNSLEWDPVEPEMVCVDAETVQLLTEIERLTDRALKETGEWTGNS